MLPTCMVRNSNSITSSSTYRCWLVAQEILCHEVAFNLVLRFLVQPSPRASNRMVSCQHPYVGMIASLWNATTDPALDVQFVAQGWIAIIVRGHACICHLRVRDDERSMHACLKDLIYKCYKNKEISFINLQPFPLLLDLYGCMEPN